jgi:triacylglycerol lipase
MSLIILLPGIYDTAKRMAYIHNQLKIACNKSVKTIEIIPNDGSISIEEMAAQALTQIIKLRKQIGENEQIDVIGYSLGAIIIRYIIQRLNGKLIFRRFISISAPHHGTIMGYFRNGIGVKQLRPNSELLTELNQDKDPWGSIKVYSYWTPFDLMVLPSRSSELNGAINKSFFVLCHPCMTKSKKVIENIIHDLGEYNNNANIQ